MEEEERMMKKMKKRTPWRREVLVGTARSWLVQAGAEVERKGLGTR